MSTDTHFWQNSVSCQQAVSERLSQWLFLAYFYTTASLSQHLYLTCFYLITPLEAISLYLCLHLFQVSERKQAFSGGLFSGPFFMKSLQAFPELQLKVPLEVPEKFLSPHKPAKVHYILFSNTLMNVVSNDSPNINC